MDVITSYSIHYTKLYDGPAFEGGNITFGMPGLPGAIEKVKLNSDGSFTNEVIEGSVPEGICGSGLVDVLSELLQNNP